MVYTALLLVAPLVAGVAGGYAFGGRLANLGAVRLRAPWLLWIAAVVQVVQLFVEPFARFVEDGLHVPMLAVVFGPVAIWLVLNLRGRGLAARIAVAMIFVGGALNAIAIALNNGRMPYDPEAAVLAGLPVGVETRKNAPADANTFVAHLGDVIAVPPIHKVVSAGDLLIAAGVAALIAVMMTATARQGPKATVTATARGGPTNSLSEGGEKSHD
ncbi:DUF5317 family protein [Asanoa iriomotensis]|uniref:DUF5317 domain-containing protein n=1 Tax=Asanoa iriomotensis TaxID=234613 RepID=A0ABQ4C6U7_9ACTN|nr:DUF5317 family protein [Asanoa iriomotensis]GIF58166.1 hypothetical protein Air01nite_42610 [Asanoa iriomotensis]